MKRGRPRKYDTPEEMQKAIDLYFEKCLPELLKDDEGKIIKDRNGFPAYKLNPPTISGLALHLGFVSRQSMYDYESYDNDFSDTIKKARLRCENYVETAMLDGTGAPAACIFALKNYGWSDRHEIDHSGKAEIVYLDKQDADL